MKKPEKARGDESARRKPPEGARHGDRIDEAERRDEAEERDEEGKGKPVFKDAWLFGLEH
jgi:hypothetical protein